ncbi:phosphoenolpyruvate--protein phosphotransferase [Pelagicoccus sp. SDUM812003]|uniref:phosphoenolpyruvate--protein phosphotransferase n=1 Tax=Pelagicoccus sp. SDUM812003 TaxID=3041267 RepID=UPI00280CD2D3|nr:phosphoenolpyruvate--protein phosphotransferase [Pelagicoccus sp. SDUM812003]MDQ8204300.1 phosphoenolpyruvate--protein phosphotransferase [Pelagicoccus sp. SDUM812003]
MTIERSERTIKGKPISTGLAEGRAYVYREPLQSLDLPTPIIASDVEREIDFLEKATGVISEDLASLATKVEKEMDARLASVFEAHKMMVNDPSLKIELQTEIRDNLVSASSAVRSVFLRWEKRFLLMESQISRHKGDDMKDLSNRLSNALSGIKVNRLGSLPSGGILVAKRLLPSDTVFLSKQSAAAVLLEYGGASSHAALFAREMGLPCIAQVHGILQRIQHNAPLLVDAELGTVVLHPSKKSIAAFQKKISRRNATVSRISRKSHEPAFTIDGTSIQVLANISSRADADRAVDNGADGVGLYRTELAYLGRSDPPSEDELLEEMQHTLAPFEGKPVTIRLLDIGADKPLSYTGFLAESNPALGRRGIRLLLEFPQLLDTQLRAILRFSTERDARILIPMATLTQDITATRERLTVASKQLAIAQIPPLGIMIETPAAALSLKEFASFCDFASFGSNDLTQYAFAADRENAAVEPYFQDSHGAILRLMEIARADAPDLPLSICGELAGRSRHTEEILRCGLRSLSVAPPMIPEIKDRIRKLHYARSKTNNNPTRDL